uniref:F-box protein AT5G49610-like beta-propeller domain-containing protein n=1 Tax=Oryza meridionalis TaxID=40149 RepID=A0A0E0DCT0_9ORYZ
MEIQRNKKKPRKGAAMVAVVEAEGASQDKGDLPLSPEAMDEASRVLGNNDLLKEILLSLGLHILLVHAALVCKRWLHIIANPEFLGRFGKLHPPRLLASYVSTMSGCHMLVPSQGLPTEFVSILSRAKDYFSDLEKNWCGDDFDVLDWRNGQVLISVENSITDFQRRLAICTPLNPTKDFTFIPHRQLDVPQGYIKMDIYDFFYEKGANGRMSIYRVRLGCTPTRQSICAMIFGFKNGAWSYNHISAVIDLPSRWLQRRNSGLLIDTKFYMLGPSKYILGLDLVSMSLFIIDLPNGLEHSNPEMLQLSREEDSMLYIIHLNGLQLHIWFHGIDNTDNTSNWVLIDTVSLLEVFGHIANPSWDSEVDIKIARGGNSGDFIYLHVDDDVYLVHIKKRMVEKVFDNSKVFRVHPFMMAWPTTFTKKIMMGNILK